MKTPYVEENCTVKHEGREFTAGGAVVTPTHAIGYPAFDKNYIGATGNLYNWQGDKVIGAARIVSRWCTPNSFVSSHMHQIECVINGVTYTGRGAGSGMIWKGKVKK